MKFKKGDRVECLFGCHGYFTKGKVYIVKENNLDKYGNIMIETNDKGSNTDGWRPECFKLIEENKMKTDKKVMAQIYRKIAENIDNDVENIFDSIEVYITKGNSSHEGWSIIDNELYSLNPNKYEYRIKPETITLRNGVTIPKPLDVDSIDNDKFYYYPCVDRDYFDRADGRRIKDSGTILFYASMNEAREAGKALFGIED